MIKSEIDGGDFETRSLKVKVYKCSKCLNHGAIMAILNVDEIAQ